VQVKRLANINAPNFRFFESEVGAMAWLMAD
jgi:hypothetical protein